MIRPRITETIGALGRAVKSAGLEFDGVDRILLVGGTSRIPLVAEMVREATGRPIAVDAHPKHSMALGAAIVAEARRRPPETRPRPWPGPGRDRGCDRSCRGGRGRVRHGPGAADPAGRSGRRLRRRRCRGRATARAAWRRAQRRVAAGVPPPRRSGGDRTAEARRRPRPASLPRRRARRARHRRARPVRTTGR